MKLYRILMFVFLLTVSCASIAQSDLLNTTKKARIQEHSNNKNREGVFHSKEQTLRKLRERLLIQRSQLQENIDRLSDQFSINERTISEQEKKLHLDSGSLGELFGVVRQVAKELQVELAGTVAAIGEEQNLKQVEFIAAAKTLPSKQQLYSLWHAFTQQFSTSSTITKINVPYVQPDGILKNKTVTRIGSFGLIDENGYLNWSGDEGGARSYLVQPEYIPQIGSLNGRTQLVTLDPSAGQLLSQLSLVPTLAQRIGQGGAIGKVILVLLVVGLLIGLAQGTFLLISRIKIRAQLKDINTIGNNALGRVLGVYKYDKSPNVEALELRLYETVLDEQQKLERGLSMLKLLAALAPMLGLLGTVTGMIETFQVITQYGNADPRMMASGISTALVTTVLGLIAAMPLLFIHNVLGSQAENVRTLLEKKGVGLVAERAEQDMELS